MKWAVLVAALVALLIVESFSAPTPKDKKAKNAKGINEKETKKKDVAIEDNNKKVEDAKDADAKDEDVKNADEKDEEKKNADEKNKNVKNADEKDEDVKNVDEKDEDVKNADERDVDGEDGNEKDDNVKTADEKDEDVKNADKKNEDEEDTDEKDEDVKDADKKDEVENEKKSKTIVKTGKKKKASTKTTKAKNETDKKKEMQEGSEDDSDNVSLGITKTKKETSEKKNSKKAINKVKTEVTLDITETQTTMTKDEKTETTKEAIVGEIQEKNNDNTGNEYKEGISEEEVNMDDEYVIDELGAEAVKGNEKNLIEDMTEDLYLPISGRLKSAMLPESERVMDEPDFLPRAEAVMGEAAEGSEGPTAERVMMAQEAGTKPGGDGKMKMNLNLKDLDGNPSDLTVGAAAVGLMSQAVKSKGPDDNQVNAVAGFGHQIMSLVSELEKDSK